MGVINCENLFRRFKRSDMERGDSWHYFDSWCYIIFIGWGLLTAKTYLGGLKAVIWQDVIQGTILTIGVILLFFIIIKDSSGWNTIVANAQLENQEAMLDIFNITPTEILIYLLTLSFFQFIRQDVWQRIWAAKSLKTAQIS